MTYYVLIESIAVDNDHVEDRVLGIFDHYEKANAVARERRLIAWSVEAHELNEGKK